MRTLRAWSYDHTTQIATGRKVWEELDETGAVVRRVEFGPVGNHVVFPFEMEHLFARVGLDLKILYGDFFEHPLAEDSPDLIWLARRP